MAFRPAPHPAIGLDGAATQDAAEWWTGLRRGRARGDRRRRRRRRGSLHVVAITGQYGSSVPVGADGEPVGDVLLWADTRARESTRPVIGGPVNIGGFAPHKALPVRAHHRGAPAPQRQRTHRPLAAAARAAAPMFTRRPQRGTRAGGLPRAPVHRARRGHPGVDARLVDHRQPSIGGAVRVRGRAPRADAAGARRSFRSRRTGACSAALLPRWRGNSVSRHGVPVVCGIPRSPRGRRGLGSDRPRTTPTSPSPPRRGSAPASPSSAPTSCTRSPPSRASTLRTPSSSTTRRPAAQRSTGCASRSSLRTTACLAAAAASARRAQPPRALSAVVRRPVPCSPGRSTRVRGRAVHALAQRRAQPGGGQDRARGVAEPLAAHRPRDARALGARGRRLQRALAVRRLREVPPAVQCPRSACSAEGRRATSGARSTRTSSGAPVEQVADPRTRSSAASRCGRGSASASLTPR